jgi:hypothetical protein
MLNKDAKITKNLQRMMKIEAKNDEDETVTNFSAMDESKKSSGYHIMKTEKWEKWFHSS